LGLVDVALAGEDGLALEHFTKDTTGAPHVDGRCVLSQLEKQLRWSVPPRHNKTGVIPSCFTVALASLWYGFVVVSRETKVCNLESPTIVDKQVGRLHVSMQNVVVVEISQALEQLQHVAFDLRFQKLDVGVVEESRQIMIHVRRDHIEYRTFPALGLGPFYCHLFQSQDIVVRQHLQKLDLAQRSDGKAVLFVVHQNFLQRVDAASNSMPRLVHFTKSSLAELLQHLVLADLGTSFEAALQILLRGRI
jgi:hypothetical protein